MASNSQKDETVRMSFVLIPRFNMMALTSTIEPMRVANYLTGKILFSWDFLSSEGGPVTSSNGMPLETIALTEPDRKIDRVFVCGSWDSEHYEDKALFAWLRRLDRIGVHLGAMDIGTYILARAGLMGGYRAAILWYCSHAFAEAFPDTIVEEMLYVTDRKRSTIAGGAAGMDMMLDDISRRHTPQFAHEIAEHIIHHQVRGPETLQRTLPDTQFEIMHPSVRKAITMMYRNVEEPLSIPEVAEHVNISQRKMERLFQKHVGRSAIAHYRLLRLQHARVMLTNTNLSIREISVACGYLSLSHFAKSFAEQYGRRPRDCREAWPLTDPAPVWPG
ncbi:MAG: GlxA family transcriptional regulator, partial [Rhodospirillales bacterium]|nr:GlxA family transcriptional regulator [Rhodospirillales bacterium]